MNIKKFITSLLGTGLIAFTASAQFGNQVASPSLYTNYTIASGGANANDVVLLTNANKISQVQVLGGASGTTTVVQQYDNNLTNTTYTNVSYTNFLIYPTNFVNTTVSALTGVTNTYTNAMLFETNYLVAAATNNYRYSIFAAPGGTIATYSVDIINVKGLLLTSASTNGQVFIQYRNNNQLLRWWVGNNSFVEFY